MHLVDLITAKQYFNNEQQQNIDWFLDSIQTWVDGRIVDICNQQIALTQYADPDGNQGYQFAGNGTNTKMLPNFPARKVINQSTGLPYNTSLLYTSQYPSAPGGQRVWSPVQSWWEIQNDDAGVSRVYNQGGFYGNSLFGGGWSLGWGWGTADRNWLLNFVYGYPAIVQMLYTLGNPTSGTFTITWNNQTTGALLYNATASDVKAALLALTGMDANVQVIGGALPSMIVVTFSGSQYGFPMTTTDSLIGASGVLPVSAVSTNQMPATIRRIATEMFDIIFKESDLKGLAGSRLGLSSITVNNLGSSVTTTFNNNMARWAAELRPFTLLPQYGYP